MNPIATACSDMIKLHLVPVVSDLVTAYLVPSGASLSFALIKMIDMADHCMHADLKWCEWIAFRTNCCLLIRSFPAFCMCCTQQLGPNCCGGVCPPICSVSNTAYDPFSMGYHPRPRGYSHAYRKTLQQKKTRTDA